MSRGRNRKKGSLFGRSRYRKYSRIVEMDDIGSARESARKLLQEFRSAKTRAKMRRVKRVTVLAANRAEAAAKRENLSRRERRELLRIAEIFRRAADRMRLPPRH